MNKPLDFFGNEIEVGDEVAFLQWSNLVRGTISKIEDGRVYALDAYGGLHYLTDMDYSEIIVNTEKKHREKALDYLAAETQKLGAYDGN